MFVTIKCPDCGYHKVVNGRGRCRCGTYLINHFADKSIFLPDGRVWVIYSDGTTKLLSDGRR